MFFHNLEAEFHLFLNFRIVRRQQVALGSFRRKQDIVLLQFQAIKKLLGEYDASGGANGAKLEFREASSITITIIMQSGFLSNLFCVAWVVFAFHARDDISAA